MKHSGSIFQRTAARASSQRASALALASGYDACCLAHKRRNSYWVGMDGKLLWERGEEDEMKTPARETFYNILSSLLVNNVVFIGFKHAGTHKQTSWVCTEQA